MKNICKYLCKNEYFHYLSLRTMTPQKLHLSIYCSVGSLAHFKLKGVPLLCYILKCKIAHTLDCVTINPVQGFNNYSSYATKEIASTDKNHNK